MADISYIPSMGTLHTIYKTFHQFLCERARDEPQKELFVQHYLDGRRHSITNEQLYIKAKNVAKFLVKKGIGPGDRVCIIGPNSIEWIIAEFGIIIAGAIAIHLQMHTEESNDIKESCDKSKCKAVFALIENEALSTAVEKMIEKENRMIVLMQKGRDTAHVTIGDILALPEEDVQLPEIYPENEAFVFTTSGSTGKPKMVVHTHISVQNYVHYQHTDQITVVYNDNLFTWAGFPLVSVIYGQKRVFMTSEISMERKNLQHVWKIMKDEGCQLAVFLPYILKDMVEILEDLKSFKFKLKRLVTGGQQIENVFKLIGILCDDLLVSYGSTECPSVSQIVLSGTTAPELGDVGTPLGWYEVKIVDDEGKPVKNNCLGSVRVRSPIAFKRYLENDELTNSTLSHNEWIKIGDLGKITTKGHLIIYGKEKDVITRGTQKVIPSIIENVVKKLQQVILVSVIPVPDKKMGEEVCLCYVSKNKQIATNDIKEVCEKHFLTNSENNDDLGETPTYILPFDSFPKLSNGKIDKITLARRANEKLKL